jgi:hypothetical protein
LPPRKAIALNRSFALGHLVLGLSHLFGGDALAAIAPLEHGLSLNPNDPQNFAWYTLLALGELLAGDDAGCVLHCRRGGR